MLSPGESPQVIHDFAPDLSSVKTRSRHTLRRDSDAALAERRDLASASVTRSHALISGALRRGACEAGVRFDLDQLVPAPGLTVERRGDATDAQLVAVFAAAVELGGSWLLLFRLACATGMRRGELVALRWSSLDAYNCLYANRGIIDDVGGSVETARKNGHPRYVDADGATAGLGRTSRAHVQECGATFDRRARSSNSRATAAASSW